MNFAELYHDNRDAVERALKAMWSAEIGNESQLAYSRRLRDVIQEVFAPKDAVPVVQFMNSYKPVPEADKDDAISLVAPLWTKSYSPYLHQYQCWQTLLKEKSPEGFPMSICVTTGTGSGKTECFMLPLVKDLSENFKPGEIQAIFLYPLNALMEDQKERLEELVSLITDKEITYAVYNGDLPENEPSPNDHSDDAERTRRRINMIRGWDKNTHEFKYKHILYTRKMVRDTPPNILLTNPTMLEYILLRKADENLINPDAQSLRWITLDETHTYTGAGAAELALLLRRIILAFGVHTSNVRFATSSATFGNGTDQQGEEQKLKEFISKITGLNLNQVRPIGGDRIKPNPETTSAEDLEKWNLIAEKEFISLNDLFEGDDSIEDKLKLFDEMCARVALDAHNTPYLKAKVHYFYRVPNNGLYVRLSEHEDGAFKIYTRNELCEASREDPLLELCRCKHCGEYVALAQVNVAPGDDYMRYSAIERDESDIFDLSEDQSAQSQYAIIGLSKEENKKGDNNVSMVADNGFLRANVALEDNQVLRNPWHLVVNTQRCCPCCNVKLARKKDSDETETGDSVVTLDNAYLLKFRTSPEFISRILAPSILDHVDKNPSGDPTRILLHDGQQYLSFADSRQLAARATLKQNLEQECEWVYSTIYHELCRRANSLTKEDAISQIMAAVAANPLDIMKYADIMKNLNSSDESVVQQQLQQMRCRHMTWWEIANLLKSDPYCSVYCSAFVKRSGDDSELATDGTIPEDVMNKYIQSIMVMYLSTRPASASAPETLGLFCSYYPQLNNIEQLPEAVERFNAVMHEDQHKISLGDWLNLIQVFMDYTVRSNQSVFLKLSDTNPIDIFACKRFAFEKPKRRPAKKPICERGTFSQSRIVRYLCELLVMDIGNTTPKDAYNQHFDLLNDVVEAFWTDLTNDKNKLLEYGSHWNNETQKFENDKDNPYRFNLKNLCFKLYEDVYLCDTNADSMDCHIECLRPIENHFKMFSPYLRGNTPDVLDEKLHEIWETYPYYKGCGQPIVEPDVATWAATHRNLLWENHLWGEDGCFSNRLMNIHVLPNLFIQAEHTAQVDKDVARMMQTDFKNHLINIMACSTTMEMGVDLGNLEVVMLSSVPPQPSNYKQRAGRSGRNNKVKSACVTLCGSDAIGLRTLFNPIDTIINRPVQVPTIDLMSPQVVQRHVNAFLIRAFGVFADGNNGGRLTQRVTDYYTPFEVGRDGDHIIIKNPQTNEEQSPLNKLGDSTGTKYESFNNECLKAIPQGVKTELLQLLHETIYDGCPDKVVRKASDMNKRCYTELNTKLEDLAFAFTSDRARNSEKFRTKLKMQYYEVLLNRLLNYWATNRFTPNANMPVNVLSLDLNSSTKSFYRATTSSNPSYTLRDAIAQYAPGNSIVVDGVSYIVRGVELTNMYRDINVYKTIYRNSTKCVIDDAMIDGKLRWTVNKKEGLELIQPVGFLPDMNEAGSRIIDNNKYTHVSAQLIDTNDWPDVVTEPHLFSVISNKDSGKAKILYYNEGLGYGYCLCSQCGRMTLETGVANPDDSLDDLPVDMNTIKPRDDTKPRYHYAINTGELRRACGGYNRREKIRRNVIIGDVVQTDFSEIRIRHFGQNHWINTRAEDSLMFTLGVVFTQSLLDILGKERGAVDFTVMPNGHLCIFDTNPGGAGYANQMTNLSLMKEIISNSKTLLETAKQKNSKDFLLNKFTLRYIDKIDIDVALAWIQEESDATQGLPTNITTVSAYAKETSISNMQTAYNTSDEESVFFVTNDYEKWNYDGENPVEAQNADNLFLHSWRAHFGSVFHVHDKVTSLCVICESDDVIPDKYTDMLRCVKYGWAKDVIQMKNPYANLNIYPIAYIDGILYFTNNKDCACLNDAWANSNLYCARIENICKDVTPVDCSYKVTTTVFELDGEDTYSIVSNQLGEIIQAKSEGIVDRFLNHCKLNSEDPVIIEYQDKYLRTMTGIVITLQTIAWFVKQIPNNFSLKFSLEKYEDGDAERTNNLVKSLSNPTRDQKLNDLTEGWLYKLKDEHVYGKLEDHGIESVEVHTLVHWRTLSFVCAGMRLNISPNGGFANEWGLDKQRFPAGMRNLSIDEIDSDTQLYLKRLNPIKYDVKIEDASSNDND